MKQVQMEFLKFFQANKQAHHLHHLYLLHLEWVTRVQLKDIQGEKELDICFGNETHKVI